MLNNLPNELAACSGNVKGGHYELIVLFFSLTVVAGYRVPIENVVDYVIKNTLLTGNKALSVLQLLIICVVRCGSNTVHYLEVVESLRSCIILEAVPLAYVWKLVVLVSLTYCWSLNMF